SGMRKMTIRAFRGVASERDRARWPGWVSRRAKMNRKERRAARSSLGRKPPQIVAVHESSHAVAKTLAIGELGYGIEQAVDHIEMGSSRAAGNSIDGAMRFYEEGVTYGTTFSAEIEAAGREYRDAYVAEHGMPMGDATLQFLSKMIEFGRAAGADIQRWFQVRVFDAVFASVAEAVFVNRTFADVWGGYEVENDHSSIARNAVIAGIPDEQI